MTMALSLYLLHNSVSKIAPKVSSSETTLITQMLKAILSNPESYDSYLQQEREAGKEVTEYEEAKRFVEEEGFNIRYGHGHHLRYELQVVDAVLHLLSHRQWSLLIAEEGASDFVCSDHPVALFTIGDPPQNPDHPYNVGRPRTCPKQY